MKTAKNASKTAPRKIAGPKTIDQYIAGFPRSIRQRLEKVRLAIRRAAPKAQEKISYRMPAFFQQGMLIYFAAFKNHIGLYPRGGEFRRELSKYAGGKGTIQIPHDEPLPLELIGKIVEFRVNANLKKAATRKTKKTS